MSKTAVAQIDPTQFTSLVDPALYPHSGKVFYSGRAAFSAPTSLYLLGLNPGGSVSAHASDTIGRNLTEWQRRPELWSEYRDESWEGANPGKHGLAPRVLHLFDQLGLDPRLTPTSNVVFVRSNNEAALAQQKRAFLTQCWPVHRAVIKTLGVTTVMCLGATAGRWVKALLGATELAGRFVETNSRKWGSEAHISPAGLCVLTLTHPSRADWTNRTADPTPLVREMLAR